MGGKPQHLDLIFQYVTGLYYGIHTVVTVPVEILLYQEHASKKQFCACFDFYVPESKNIIEFCLKLLEQVA